MTAPEMHYDFDIKFDRVASEAKPSFLPEEKDWFLNEAQWLFIKQRYQINNNYRMGVETIQKRIDDLRNLIVKFPDQPLLEPDQVSSGLYELPLNQLKYKYLFLLAQSANVIDPSTGCEHKARMKFIQHDDLEDALYDPFNSPDKNNVLFNFGYANDTAAIYIYTGDMVLTSVKVEYLREPRKINLGGYVYLDGETYPRQDCELASHTHNEIVDIAVSLASMAVEDMDRSQNAAYKLTINE